MPVPDEMRLVEQEIDRAIRVMPIWKHSREVLLHQVLTYYRDAIEWLTIIGARGMIVGSREDVHFARSEERTLRAGVLQALKWAMEFSCQEGMAEIPSFEAVHELIRIAANYEILVDYLKSANHDLVRVEVDPPSKTVRVYEGGDVTGSDSQLFFYHHDQIVRDPHVDLTYDTDQLTSKWSAGQLRQLLKHLAELAREASDTIFYDSDGRMVPLFRRPSFVEIPDSADSALGAALNDMSLTPAKIQGQGKWQLISFLDTPLVMVGKRRIGISDILIALEKAGYDHMLRLANLVDPDQYSKVSGLREERMMGVCEQIFGTHGWRVQTKKVISGPPHREIDVFADREDSSVLIQLKSTLRPESPWEVFKRNEDILHGIKHTSEVSRILSPTPLSFVITDGYRGDYAVWSSALEHSIPVGTLRDLDDIALDPAAGFELLKRRIGFDPDEPFEKIPDRSFEIMGWKMWLIDA